MGLLSFLVASYLISCTMLNAYVLVNIKNNMGTLLLTIVQLKFMFALAAISKLLQFILMCLGHTTIVYIIIPLDFLGGILGFIYIEHNMNQNLIGEFENILPPFCMSDN